MDFLTVFNINKKKKEPIPEAHRYLEKARKILSKNGRKKGEYYNSKRYVRKAGNTAWKGVLIAVEALTQAKTNKNKKARVSIDDYRDYEDKFADINYINHLDNLYIFFHFAMSCDGCSDYVMVNTSLKRADEFISKIEKKLKLSGNQ